MAKEGLDISTAHGVLREDIGWSLCIGAGTNLPVVPDWFALVKNLIDKKCREDRINIELYKKMGFSAEAMIQAVKNHIQANDEEFIRILSEELYSPVRDKISPKEWASFQKIHELTDFSEISEEDWENFDAIIRRILKQTSANVLAKAVIEAIQKKSEPRTILTFNGEAIFLSLLNYYSHKKSPDNENRFDRIVNGITSRHIGRIPYIQCHGVLPINDAAIKKGYIADNKLVFFEESYLELANNPMSWQAINFIETCTQSQMVFVGVSLSDANMRRWLGWIHRNKLEDLKRNGMDAANLTEHFWINKKPKTMVEKIWTEETVAHLGVRLVWIDSWDQVGDALGIMLGN